MDPLQMLNNDLSNFLMSVQPIMEHWKDSNSDRFNEECVNSIRNRYKRYVDSVNPSMQNLIRQENRCMELLREIENLK